MEREKIINLIRIYTGGYPRRLFWTLTGNVKRNCRNHILSELLGCKIKCGQDGITRLREELFKMFNISENCIAYQEEELFQKMGI